MSEQMELTSSGDYQSDDVRAVTEYRSVSGMAVAAAVLGVASLLAIVTSSLMFLCVLGILASLIALRAIAASDGTLVGRPAAYLGLVLSLGVLGGLMSYDWTMKVALADQATPWAEQWCELVQDGKLETALELTRAVRARQILDDKLPEYYETNEAAKQELVEFRQDEVISRLQQAGEDSQLTPGPVLDWERDGRGNFRLVQVFHLVSDDSSDYPFRLIVHKTGPSNSLPGVWRVERHLAGAAN